MADQANTFSNVPARPLLASKISAVPPVCNAMAELLGMPEGDAVEVPPEEAEEPADEAEEPAVPPADEAAEEPEEPEPFEPLAGRVG